MFGLTSFTPEDLMQVDKTNYRSLWPTNKLCDYYKGSLLCQTVRHSLQ